MTRLMASGLSKLSELRPTSQHGGQSMPMCGSIPTMTQVSLPWPKWHACSLSIGLYQTTILINIDYMSFCSMWLLRKFKLSTPHIFQTHAFHTDHKKTLWSEDHLVWNVNVQTLLNSEKQGGYMKYSFEHHEARQMACCPINFHH